MELETLTLLVAFVSSISGLTILGFWFRFRLKQLSNERDSVTAEKDTVTAERDQAVIQVKEKKKEKKTRSYNVGVNTTLGGIHELLGKFAYFTKLKSWWFLSGPSKQAPIDMIGIRDGYLEIIEFKKNGAKLTVPQNEVRKIVELHKVRYVVLDVKIPDNVTVKPRELKPIRNGNEKICEHRSCTNKGTEIRNVPYVGDVVHICKEHADIYWGFDDPKRLT